MKSSVCLLLLAGALAAADLPYIGKWKMNPDKSDFQGTTITYAQMPSGEMKVTVDGMSYTFKTDGKEYPAIFGQTATWKKLDGNTWETVNKMNGKVLGTDTIKVSADGKGMMVESKGTKPSGEAFDDRADYARVSGGPGLEGRWKTTKVNVSSPNVWDFAPYEGDGLTINIAAYQATCKAKFDGKDYPATGPTVPKGMTLALKKTGARSFELTEKVDGKVIYKSEYAVSANGKTMTETGAAVATNEKIKMVYDRQ